MAPHSKFKETFSRLAQYLKKQLSMFHAAKRSGMSSPFASQCTGFGAPASAGPA
jgi:hypothetical protein